MFPGGKDVFEQMNEFTVSRLGWIISRLGRRKFRSANKKFPIPSVYVRTWLFEQSLALYIWPVLWAFSAQDPTKWKGMLKPNT